jgi:hypothetical protein
MLGINRGLQKVVLVAWGSYFLFCTAIENEERKNKCAVCKTDAELEVLLYTRGSGQREGVLKQQPVLP